VLDSLTSLDLSAVEAFGGVDLPLLTVDGDAPGEGSSSPGITGWDEERQSVVPSSTTLAFEHANASPVSSVPSSPHRSRSPLKRLTSTSSAAQASTSRRRGRGVTVAASAVGLSTTPSGRGC
jgi:hypothetical protein